MTSIQKHIEEASEAYSSTFSKGDLPLPPAKHYLVVTCMDARIDPAAAFSIPIGDAHIIRNAGGSAEDALRSIIISEQLLNTKEIVLVKHTDCGMLTFKNEDAYAVVEKQLGAKARSELEGKEFDFLPFKDLETAVRDDVRWLKGSNLIPDDVEVSGWVYDVKTGKTGRVI